jgi:4-amino-4-deoxy-L-arabinose transferase-like glycosyltransferase
MAARQALVSDSIPMPEMRLLGRLARRPVPVLIFLCLLAWLPGVFALPPLDRDESRFAQASRQMIESGNYIDIRFSTVPRYNKPVGIYWAQAAATRVLGHPPYSQIWTYRLPSLIGGLLAVLLTYWSARAFASRETALLAGAMLALCLALSAEAEMATTDALLLATIVAAQGFFLRVYLHACGRLEVAPQLWVALAGWAAVGLGILLKGPVILAVVALTAIALSLWDRDWKWLRGLCAGPGILVMLAVVLPWSIAIAFASHGAFYQRSLGHDFAAKILAGQEMHGAPPGYYLVLFSITFWPVTLLALPGIGNAVAQRTDPVFRYLLAWLIPSWLMFELVPTKLPHYILPVYPALAIMTAAWLMAPRDVAKRWERVLPVIATVQFVIVSLLAAAALIVVPVRLASSVYLVSAISALLVLGLSAVAVFFQLKQRMIAATGFALLSALLLYPVLSAGIAPDLGPIWMSRSIADHLAHDRAAYDPPPVLSGYVEPSAVFLLGTDTRLETGKVAGATMAQQGGLAIVEDRDRTGFLQSLHAAGGKERAIDQVFGFDYSRGRREHVTFYRVTPAPEETTPPPE